MSTYNDQRTFYKFVNSKSDSSYTHNVHGQELEVHEVKGKFTVANITKKVVYPRVFNSVNALSTFINTIKE